MQPLINSALLAVFASSPLPRRVRARPLHLSARASPSRHHPAKCDPRRSPAPPCACPSPTTHPPKCDPIPNHPSAQVRALPRSPFVNLTMALLRLPSHLSRLTSPVSPLTSYVSPLTSHLSRLTSHLLRLTSYVSPLASPVSRLTSCVSRLPSHLLRLPSYVLRLTSYASIL